MTLGGNFSINTNKFVVASSTGNTDIAGALDVTGTTELGVLNADNNVDFSGTSIAISNSNSTTNVSGIMRILKSSDSTGYNNTSAAFYTAGGASISKRLNVGGNFMVGGVGGVKTTITSTNGNISTDGTLNVAQATTIGGTLGVTGQITGNLTGDVTGTATNADNIDITNTNNNTTFYPMFAAANTGHTGAFVDSQNLTYNPYSNTLSVTNFVSTTNFEVQGNLNVTGTITFFQSQVGSIANHDTDALAEGTANLYFTDERVDDRVASLISGGTGISATYDDAGNLLTLSAVPADINTDNLTEGSTNIFYTEARFDARSQVSLQAILLKEQICTIQILVLTQELMQDLLLSLLATCLKAPICTTQTLALMHVLLQQLQPICQKARTSITQTHVPMLASLLQLLMT